MQITTIGLDLAKHVFQVHAVDAVGDVVIRGAMQCAFVVMKFVAKLPSCQVATRQCAL